MREENPLPQQPAAGAAGAQQQAGAAAADDPAKAEEAERRKAAEEGLPEGWAVAFSADKKPYYWHKQVGVGDAQRKERRTCLLAVRVKGSLVLSPASAALLALTAD